MALISWQQRKKLYLLLTMVLEIRTGLYCTQQQIGRNRWKYRFLLRTKTLILDALLLSLCTRRKNRQYIWLRSCAHFLISSLSAKCQKTKLSASSECKIMFDKFLCSGFWGAILIFSFILYKTQHQSRKIHEYWLKSSAKALQNQLSIPEENDLFAKSELSSWETDSSSKT